MGVGRIALEIPVEPVGNGPWGADRREKGGNLLCGLGRRSRRALLSAAEGWGSDGRAMPLDEGMGSIRLTAPMTFPRPVPLERARKLVRKAMDR